MLTKPDSIWGKARDFKDLGISGGSPFEVLNSDYPGDEFVEIVIVNGEPQLKYPQLYFTSCVAVMCFKFGRNGVPCTLDCTSSDDCRELNSGE